jgi:hypothetical protein
MNVIIDLCVYFVNKLLYLYRYKNKNKNKLIVNENIKKITDATNIIYVNYKMTDVYKFNNFTNVLKITSIFEYNVDQSCYFYLPNSLKHIIINSIKNNSKIKIGLNMQNLPNKVVELIILNSLIKKINIKHNFKSLCLANNSNIEKCCNNKINVEYLHLLKNNYSNQNYIEKYINAKNVYLYVNPENQYNNYDNKMPNGIVNLNININKCTLNSFNICKNTSIKEIKVIESNALIVSAFSFNCDKLNLIMNSYYGNIIHKLLQYTKTIYLAILLKNSDNIYFKIIMFIGIILNMHLYVFTIKEKITNINLLYKYPNYNLIYKKLNCIDLFENYIINNKYVKILYEKISFKYRFNYNNVWLFTLIYLIIEFIAIIYYLNFQLILLNCLLGLFMMFSEYTFIKNDKFKLKNIPKSVEKIIGNKGNKQLKQLHENNKIKVEFV